MQQLLIIGNGFDLQCGLESSYKDFFNNAILDKNGEMFGLQQMKIGCKGFWEGLLFEYYIQYGKSDYKWYDIETIIKNTLWIINYGKNAYDVLDADEMHFFPEQDKDQKKDAIEKYIFDCCNNYLTASRNSKIFKEQIDLLNKELSKALKSFERRFCKYIKSCIINPENESQLNNYYVVKAVNLLAKLTDFTERDFEDIDDIFDRTNKMLNFRTINELIYDFKKLNNTRILSFNYTALFDILYVDSPCLYSNVHGKLCLEKCDEKCNGSSIIFGIDDTVIQSQKDQKEDRSENANDELRLFSKTYRKMSDTSAPQSILPKKDNVPLTIKFYGHSLSKADYSYFQSIFDYYNLYDNSKVGLMFYYPKGREVQTDAIYRLINDYGNTHANKEQGKNLMHKLLLENRIKIIELSLDK